MDALREVLLKPEAKWSNEGQKLAVMAGLQWKQDLIVALPTGSGKSAIVATVAKLEKLKVTAVLCPLRSLLSDWKRRLTELQYPFEVFNKDDSIITGDFPIILVSLDATAGLAWTQAVASLKPGVEIYRANEWAP